MVEVLMSTYNGGKYVQEQIESIISQSIDTHITVRDDGSRDSTINIISKYPNVNVLKGINQGVTESFLTLIEKAPEREYYAFADQDDLWDVDKLEVAVKQLERYSDIPALYSSNTRFVNADLEFLKAENSNPTLTLGSALVKNYATGCTIVFNKKLMDELKRYRPIEIPCHDWWVNVVCLAVGGVSVYDREAHISYRQHNNNVVGGNSSFSKKWISRLNKFFAQPYHRDRMAKQVLDVYGEKINYENQKLLICLSNKKRNRKLKTNNCVDDILFSICFLLGRI